MSLVTPRKGYKFSHLGLSYIELQFPEEWEIIALGLIISDIKGGAPLTPSDFSKSGFPVLHKGDIQNNDLIKIGKTNPYCSEEFASEHQNNIVDSSYMLITLRDLVPSAPAIGLIVHSNGNYLLAQGAYGFHIDKVKLDSNFLVHLANSYFYRQLMRALSVGSTQVHIRTPEFLKIKIQLPPLPEQQKIATILSNVDNLIESTGKVITHSKKVKTGLMQKLLTRGIGHTKFKKVPWLFGKEIEIPEEWEMEKFEKFTNKITYGFTNPMPTTNEGAWMITATNIKNGRIIYETARKTSWDAYDNLITIKSRPKKDLILITKDGTLGEVAIVDRDNICINQSVASIDYDSSKISSNYLLITLQSKLIKQFIDIFSPQTTIRHIYITDIPNWKMPLPPLSEQQKIASILSNIDDKITSQVQYKEKLEKLKKSLMQKLLTGEVRV